MKKTTKFATFVGHRFQVVLGQVLEGFWEAKNFDFGDFFEAKSMSKKHDVLEGGQEAPKSEK